MVHPLKEVVKPQVAFLSDKAAVEREANKELACLVQAKGWVYAQRVANEIQQEFACLPTDPNWHVYTTVQYALNQLFGRVRKRAADAVAQGPGRQSITAEITQTYDSPSRRDSTSKRGTTSGRRGARK